MHSYSTVEQSPGEAWQGNWLVFASLQASFFLSFVAAGVINFWLCLHLSVSHYDKQLLVVQLLFMFFITKSCFSAVNTVSVTSYVVFSVFWVCFFCCCLCSHLVVLLSLRGAGLQEVKSMPYRLCWRPSGTDTVCCQSHLTSQRRYHGLSFRWYKSIWCTANIIILLTVKLSAAC